MDALPLGLTGDSALRAAVTADREVTRMEGVRLDHLAQYLGEVATEWNAPAHAPGTEQTVQLGGPGTPLVPEFAVCEVAAALGLTQPAATGLCADVLDLAYRLRRVAGSVRAGALTFARARVIARRTRELPAEHVMLVEDKLCRLRLTGSGPMPIAALVPMSRLRGIIDQAVITVRGPESETEAEQRVAESLYVDVRAGEPGAADVAGRLAAADGVRLDRRLDEIAGWLTQVGDGRPKPILRAVALGLLADPDLLSALADLRNKHATDDPAPPSEPPESGEPGEGRGHADDNGHAECSAGASDTAPVPAAGTAGLAGCPPGLLQKLGKLSATVLYLHLDRASATWSEERGGILTATQARELVGHSNVTVRPVLDLAEPLTYTGYVAPPRLKEQLALLNAGYCTFPYCHRRARAGDVDHQIPASRGGQTASTNTHRPCRKHHRVKDKGGWHVISATPGVWIWTSPAGAVYLVTNGTTIPLNGITRRTQGAEPTPAADTHSAGPIRKCEPSSDVRTDPRSWSPPWDPWDDPDPLTPHEHHVTYGYLNTS